MRIWKNICRNNYLEKTWHVCNDAVKCNDVVRCETKKIEIYICLLLILLSKANLSLDCCMVSHLGPYAPFVERHTLAQQIVPLLHFFLLLFLFPLYFPHFLRTFGFSFAFADLCAHIQFGEGSLVVGTSKSVTTSVWHLLIKWHALTALAVFAAEAALSSPLSFFAGFLLQMCRQYALYQTTKDAEFAHVFAHVAHSMVGRVS